jgi:hypothetical protein
VLFLAELCRDVNYHPYSGTLDVGSNSFSEDGTTLTEVGVLQPYLEVWHRVTDGSAPQLALDGSQGEPCVLVAQPQGEEGQLPVRWQNVLGLAASLPGCRLCLAEPVFMSAVLEGHERDGVFVVVGDRFGMAIGRRPTDPVRTTTTHTSLTTLVEGLGDHALGRVLRGYRCDVGRFSRCG